MKRGLIGFICGLAAIVAAHSAGAQSPTTAAPRFGTWGIDLSGQNAQIKPGDDFFRFANGSYLQRTEIPPDRSRFGVFDALRILSEERVRGILERAAGSAPSATQARIGGFYQAYMNEARIDELGTAPLEADLERVRAVKTREDAAALMGSRSGFFEAPFWVSIHPDAKNPGRYAVHMGTGGMGLPDRNYYLQASFAAVKEKYQAYIAQMLGLAGWPEAETRAKDILVFETRIAEASWERSELRNRDKTYNPTTLVDLQAYAAGFDFKRFLVSAELSAVPRIVLTDNSAFPRKAAIFTETSLETLKAWIAFNLIDSAAPYLPSRFVEARFEFRNKTLAGQPELGERWKRAVNATNAALGEDVGQEYVKLYFPPDSKRQMLDLVANLRTAFRARLQRLEWMSAETKTKALEKLEKFTVKIAYPDKWRDYSALSISPTDLYGNVKRARAFEWDYDVARLNEPIDRLEWGMTPQTVNAYYSPSLNEIVFPAAILQPPFFDPQADPAVNYGGIGGVIGHEMSHGFDDQGRKSDGEGRLQDWWTTEDATQFDERAQRLGAQYATFELLPGQTINGQLTMGENIGDLGGLNFALEAYHTSLNGKPAAVIDGTRGDQRVFLSWAQIWRGKTRDEALRQQLHTDPHSPFEARVNGVVRNMDTWYAAFGVKPGEKLYLAPEQRVRIW
jgi:putative endopeptidase